MMASWRLTSWFIDWPVQAFKISKHVVPTQAKIDSTAPDYPFFGISGHFLMLFTVALRRGYGVAGSSRVFSRREFPDSMQVTEKCVLLGGPG